MVVLSLSVRQETECCCTQCDISILSDGKSQCPYCSYLPVMPLVRYIAAMTPTEKAMLTDRNWPLVSLLVFTCAAAEQPKSFSAHQRGQREWERNI